MAKQRGKAFEEGDVVKQHHLDFLTNVMGKPTAASGKVILSPRRHFGLEDEVTPAGAKSLNIALTGPNAGGPGWKPGLCSPGAINCVDFTNPVTGVSWHKP